MECSTHLFLVTYDGEKMKILSKNFKVCNQHKINIESKLLKSFISLLACLLCCINVFASGETVKSNLTITSNQWQFELTPYLWMAGLNGHVKIGRLPTETIDASPTDILKALDFGLMGMLEVHKDYFGFLGDAMYVNLAKTFPSIRFDSANVKLIQQLYELAGMYRPLETASASLDLVGGARYLNLQSDLSVDASNPKASVLTSPSIAATAGWWDGFVGIRGLYSLTNHWKLVGYADIGTGGSQMSWQAIAGVNYVFSDNLIGKIGYRILSEDYNKGKLDYNMRMGGFYLGLSIKF